MNFRFILICTILHLFLAGCKKNVDPSQDENSSIELSESGLISSSPLFPQEDTEITLSFDPEKGNKALSGTTGEIYAHIGVLTDQSENSSDWRYTKTEWTENTTANKLTLSSSGTYQMTLSPRAYFDVPEGEKITHLVMVFRNADGSLVGRNEDGTDIFMPIYEENTLYVRFVLPEKHPTYVPTLVEQQWVVGQSIALGAVASETADITISVNEQTLLSEAAAGTASYTFTTAGTYTFEVSAKQNGQTATDVFEVFVSGEAEIADLPAGVTSDGVTFLNNGTSAVFVLMAPDKQSVSLIGEFNDWELALDGVMKKTTDGQKWWIQIDNLDPALAYAYQFVVDGSTRIADPNAELVLDPDNDSYIDSGTFPNLKAYPTGKTTGIVSVAGYDQNPYAWRNSAFDRPYKHDLVIYELHLRDFLDMNNYQTLVDTLDYLSRLGINALQLMPINEFEGNSSWGYNPSFYFAPDKYYGTKTNLKKLIDECHGRGIAVILDVVLNHSFGQSPMVQLYSEQGEPTAANPWFNVVARHPYNVGYDFNHESTLTKAFTKDVLKFWMEEYRVDGFRFDLSKGFTQTNSGTSDAAVAAWTAYDASRIAICKEYNNYIKALDPAFYVILEHFADDSEEQELANEGMFLWNNMNYAFNEASMGYVDNSDLSRMFPLAHGFDQPQLITYMESHDEERLMYKNIMYGNGSGSYSIKDESTALARIAQAATFLLCAPGPKMIWQFGELGYDVSIEENGRTGEKPLKWNYQDDQDRANLFRHFAKLIHIKKNNTIFRSPESYYQVSNAVKYYTLQEGRQRVLIIGNFDVISQSVTIDEHLSGTWIDNLEGGTVSWTAGQSIQLEPGQSYLLSKQTLTK